MQEPTAQEITDIQTEMAMMDDIGYIPIVVKTKEELSKEYPDKTEEAPALEDLGVSTEGLKTPGFTPEEETAARFLYLLPYIKKFAGNLNSKGLARVLYALAAYPITQTKPAVRGPQELQLFNLFNEVMAAKGSIIQYVINQQKEKNKISETKVEETNEGEVNVGV